MMLRLMFALISTGSTTRAAVLYVDVINLRSDHGVVYCELFRSADGFPNKPDKALIPVKAEIKGRSAACEFPNLSPGTYAVAAFHDEKGAGRLEKNFLGIPKEGVGVSNDVPGRRGRSNFHDSKFDMASEDKRITMHTDYPR